MGESRDGQHHEDDDGESSLLRAQDGAREDHTQRLECDRHATGADVDGPGQAERGDQRGEDGGLGEVADAQRPSGGT